MRHAFIWSRLYGGLVIIINFKDAESDEEFRVKCISKDTKLEFYGLSRYEIEETEDSNYKVKFKGNTELIFNKSSVIKVVNKKHLLV